MSEKLYEIKKLKLDDLISFRRCFSQVYQGERLEQLARSIEKMGLMNPILVRPTDDGKYEIICGHNRTAAMRLLGRDVISAEVRDGLSDEEAVALFYDSNLNQQSFADWNYSQKIKAIQYIERLTKENSHQGKRSDLEDQQDVASNGETSVHGRHKLDKNSRRSTTRDRMSRRLGIATATFSKYRSVIKLPDDILEAIARLLDEKKISLDVAYRMSRLKEDQDHQEIRWLLELVEESPNEKIDLAKLKEYVAKRNTSDVISPRAKDNMRYLFVRNESKPKKSGELL